MRPPPSIRRVSALRSSGRGCVEIVSILLPRTKDLNLNVIRITWSSEKFALANLRKLMPKNPPRGEVRLDFDGDGLRLKADRTLVLPFETVRKLTSIVED